ncbi:MAG: tyrosine--tRNA ligase [Clostridia bacterium]|nr:tyrosine--tRNA ligase [Clostridia bacterium]
MNILKEFRDRDMLAQCTNEQEVEKLLDKDSISFYIGFDPTADSLHVGHFMQMKIMSHMQKAGHRPIALFGGGTGMIGDPSGKSDMRKMLTVEQIHHNVECFKKQMSRFIDTSDGKAIFVDNADWLLDLNYVDFIRDVGVHFSVNRMLTAECYKARMEKGLTFLEFNYMLMQSYDFYKLHKDYGCRLEFGGDDQWSNIIGGVELIRRKDGEDVYGMTFKLLTNSEGKKMGKTEKGALWLDADKTSPYEFYQYWRNIGDADVIKCMKMLTFMSLDEINEYAKLRDSAINQAKEKLAYEVTSIIHGETEARNAQNAAKALFVGGGSHDDVPCTEIGESDLTDGSIIILDMLIKSGLAASKSEARRLVDQGGVTADDVKITDISASFDKDALKKGILLKKGKKSFNKIVLK